MSAQWQEAIAHAIKHADRGALNKADWDCSFVSYLRGYMRLGNAEFAKRDELPRDYAAQRGAQ